MTVVVTGAYVCPARCCLRTHDSELLWPGADDPCTSLDAQTSRPMYEVIEDTYDTKPGIDNVCLEYGEPVEDFDFDRSSPWPTKSPSIPAGSITPARLV